MQDVPDDLLTKPVAPDFFDRNFLWHYRAKALHVIDGDTFIALVDTGFWGRHEVHVRIADLNAPELNTDGGAMAKYDLEDALEGTPLPWPLRIVTRQRETVVSEVRSFERYVADVFVVVVDRLVNVKEML